MYQIFRGIPIHINFIHNNALFFCKLLCVKLRVCQKVTKQHGKFAKLFCNRHAVKRRAFLAGKRVDIIANTRRKICNILCTARFCTLKKHMFYQMGNPIVFLSFILRPNFHKNAECHSFPVRHRLGNHLKTVRQIISIKHPFFSFHPFSIY